MPSPKASTEPIALSRSRPRSERSPSTSPTSSEPPSMPSTGSSPSDERAGGAGESELRDRVHREAHPAGDDEDADRAGNDRDHGAGPEGGVHEVLVEQLGEHQCSFSDVVDVLVVRRPDDDDAAAHAQHVDVGLVEQRERLRGQHLVGRPDRPRAGREIEDAVDAVQHGVDVVGDEDHRRAGAAPARIEEVYDAPLVSEVE